MEKFTTWRDPASGIHPFLPIPNSQRWSLGSLLYVLLGAAIMMVRLPLLLGATATWLACLLALWLPHVPSFACLVLIFLLKAIDVVFGHVFLFISGFLHISQRRMSFRAGTGHTSLVLAKNLDAARDDQIHPGDIIICNSQSPIDIIYLCTKYSPIFTAVDPDSRRVFARSRWSALLHHADAGAPIRGHERRSIESVVKNAHAPIVVFPEGSTSNGRALLPFVADLSRLPNNQRIHLVGLKYLGGDGGFTPTLPLCGFGSTVHFMFTLCRQWYNTLSVKWVSSSSIYSSSSISSPHQANFNQSLGDVMSALLHTRCVTLGVKDKQGFLQAYGS